MRRILVANPKGGSGKSTVSTHLAGWYALQDNLVYLADADRQGSARHWLSLRASTLPRVRYWDLGEDDEPAPPPKDAEVATIDSPAGLHGKRMKHLLSTVDHVLVPVLPSIFDMHASSDFFAELADIKAVRKEKVKVAVLAMRVDARTRAAQQLMAFLAKFDLPLLSCIRDTQQYLQVIQQGQCLFDLPQLPTTRDRAQWQPVFDWLHRAR